MKHCKLSRKRLSNKVLGKSNPVAILEYNERKNEVAKEGTLCVSIDESHFSEKVIPLYGYCPVGEKCALRNNKGSWVAYSLLSGIASNGDHVHKIIKGSVKRVDFAQFITDLHFPEGTVLIVDNCSVHKKIEHVFAQKGYTSLFLPPYSPKFQPVELAFSKIKNKFCQLWPWPSGVEHAIEESFKTITYTDNINFFKHASACLIESVLSIDAAQCSIP
jgi:transposase